MKLPMRAILVASLLCGSTLASGATSSAPNLQVGDPAPALEPMAWVKGGPVSEFETGHIYVVMFFATWCGMSQAAMPMMSELAREHAGDVTIVGVNVREEENAQPTLDAVTEFVEKKGSSMDYIVAMDDPNKKPMWNRWMVAAGSYGIPTAFIIGRDGRLVYMGYAMDDQSQYPFGAALADALIGDSDIAAARALQQEIHGDTAQRLADMALLLPVQEAMEHKNFALAVEEADRVIAQHPRYASRLFSDKLVAMLRLDENAAVEFARQQAGNQVLRDYYGVSSDAAYWGSVAGIVSREDGLSRDIYDQALAWLESAVSADPTDLGGVMMLAALEHRLGDDESAVSTQKKAIALARAMEDIPHGYLERMQETLDTYRQSD